MTMLPIALTRFFHDSRLAVESFSRNGNVLAVRIVKDIGPETGVILFRQVSFMSTPLAMPGEEILAREVSTAGPQFWACCKLEKDWFEADDMVIEITSQEGPVYFVVAKSVDYEVTP